MSENFNGDVYIFLPMSSSEKVELASQIGSGLDAFIKKLDNTAKYECSSMVCEEIKRYPIGPCTIGLCPDTYAEDDNPMPIKADIFLVIHTNSPLALIVLILKEADFDVTCLLDNVSQGKLRWIKNDDKHENLFEYFKRKYKCEASGDGKTLICIAEKPGENMASMLSGGMYKSSAVSYMLRPETMEREIKDNLAQFDFYECYASKRSVIYVLPSIRGRRSFQDTLDDEIAIIFIMELLIFRHNAIESTGKQILSNLAKTDKLKLKDIEQLYISFGSMLIFWEKENYKYATVQRLADSIAERFELDKEQENFYQKLDQIEHIVELRSSQQTAIDGMVINGILITLTLTQVVWILIDNGLLLPLIAFLGLGVAVMVFFVIFFVRYPWRRKQLFIGSKKSPQKRG